jgi:hypothetical protein
MVSFVEKFVELFAPNSPKAEPKRYKIRNRVSKNLGSLEMRPKVRTFRICTWIDICIYAHC